MNPLLEIRNDYLPEGFHVQKDHFHRTADGRPAVRVLVTSDTAGERLGYWYEIPLHKKVMWRKRGLFRAPVAVEVVDWQRAEDEIRSEGHAAIRTLLARTSQA